MTTSHIPAAIDAVVASLSAAGLKVWDGPVVTEDFTAAVFIGYDAAADNSDYKSVVGTQDWAALGAKRRSETFSIICAAVALWGGADTKTGRDMVYALVDTVGTTLRADPSLGLPPPFVAELRPSELFTEPTDNGLQCRWVFTIDVTISRV